ncbi:hypothetical protein [Bradyrhizobium glycinis]|uniref:hypothetical protein n=1 Tax=Bradyrhizobium glycinis TaxID=2751812 RepID=UPI001FE43931|nr:hypothetical protein [Bradyrhizobium glycinis]
MPYLMHDLLLRQPPNNHHILCAFGLADGADRARLLFVSRQVKSERLSILVMRTLKLAALPAAAFVSARLLDLPPIAGGVIVLFAAMPTGAECVHLCRAVSAAGEPGLGRGGAGDAAGGGDVAGGGVGGGGR